ncbi:dedicator of cytokinesis protein 9-like [Schistocerca gregaria]|uniref:dedicator of cytokinesis protein 9-like n=1 Tax=Schistocerca gregaria TaxID=7010 RepID=UPI00211E5DA6|nr:dedicator of cytokinesis protein 9-like [Schistocerca gregaria]
MASLDKESKRKNDKYSIDTESESVTARSSDLHDNVECETSSLDNVKKASPAHNKSLKSRPYTWNKSMLKNSVQLMKSMESSADLTDSSNLESDVSDTKSSSSTKPNKTSRLLSRSRRSFKVDRKIEKEYSLVGNMYKGEQTLETDTDNNNVKESECLPKSSRLLKSKKKKESCQCIDDIAESSQKNLTSDSRESAKSRKKSLGDEPIQTSNTSQPDTEVNQPVNASSQGAQEKVEDMTHNETAESYRSSKEIFESGEFLENFEERLEELKSKSKISVPQNLLNVPEDEVQVKTINSIYKAYPDLPEDTPPSVASIYGFYRGEDKVIVYKGHWYGADTSQKAFLNAYQGRLYQAKMKPSPPLELFNAKIGGSENHEVASKPLSERECSESGLIESESYGHQNSAEDAGQVKIEKTETDPLFDNDKSDQNLETKTSDGNFITRLCSDTKLVLEKQSVHPANSSSTETSEATEEAKEQDPLNVEAKKQSTSSRKSLHSRRDIASSLRKRSKRIQRTESMSSSHSSTRQLSDSQGTHSTKHIPRRRPGHKSTDTVESSSSDASVCSSATAKEGDTTTTSHLRSRNVSKTISPKEQTYAESNIKVFELDPLLLEEEPNAKKTIPVITKSVFEVFKPASIDINPIDSVGPVRHMLDIPGHPILLQLKALHTPSNQEVFFASGAFYDIEKKVRLSEVFYFDWINEQELLYTIIHQYYPTPGNSVLNTRNIYMKFSTSAVSQFIYLIVRISTTPREEIDTIFDTYSNTNLNSKERAKMIDQSRRILNRLGKYQQAFGWLAIQIFDEKLNFKLTPKQDYYVYKMKQNMSDLALMDYFYNSEEGARKMKKMDFSLQLSGFLCTPDKIRLLNYYGSSLTSFLSQDRESSIVSSNPNRSLTVCDSVKQLIKPPRLISDYVYQVQEFLPPSVPVRNIHHDFVNNLYIYPLNLTLSGNKSKHKGLVMYVYLMDNDRGVHNALKNIYGRSYEDMFNKCFITSVFMENANIQDEVKIKLPMKLKQSHHLLFLVLSLNMRMKKDKDNEETEKFLGYCWYPIYNNSMILKDREHTAQFVPCKEMGLVNGYMARVRNDLPDNSDKGMLVFRSKLVSTIFSEDDYVNQYFDSMNNNAKTKKKSLLMLTKAHPDVLILFFPFIMDNIIESLCLYKAKYQPLIFKTLVQLSQCVFDQLNLSTASYESFQSSNLLQSYVTYHFVNPKSNSSIAEIIALNWCHVLQEGYSSSEGSNSGNLKLASNSLRDVAFFFFEMIVKSLAMRKHETNESRAEMTTPSLRKSLTEIFHYVRVYRRNSNQCFGFLNRILARTCNHLFTLLDRGFVLRLVHQHISSLSSLEDLPNRILFLKIVTAYEYYVVLNIPSLDPADAPDHFDYNTMYQRHYLSGMLIKELAQLLMCENPHQFKETRYETIVLLRNLLWKHDLDDRIHTAEQLSPIAGLYFPFWTLLVDNVRVLTNVTPTPQEHPERKEWCLCAFWIITTADVDRYLRSWFQHQSTETLLKLFVLLRTFYDTFADDLPLHRSLQQFLPCLYEVFMDELHEQILQQKSELFESFSLSLLYSFRCMNDEDLIIRMCHVIRIYISKCRRPLFRYLDTHTACGDLTYALLNTGVSFSERCRVAVASLLYLMMRTNSQEMGHFARMKLHFTSAISKIVKREDCNYEVLISILRSIRGHKEGKQHLAHYDTQIHQFLVSGIRFVYDYLSIYTLPNDYLRAEMYYQISLNYIHHPDLRISWLGDLARLQESLENYSEAACCYLQIASLISEYLMKIAGQKRPIKILPDCAEIREKTFSCICKEDPLSLVWLENNTILLPDFSEDGYTKFLSAAADLFAKANEPNLTIECFFALIYYYKENNRWEPLSDISQQVATIAHDLYEANRSQSWIPSNYYRVGFYGKDFEENGKEYIYCESPSVRLADFTSKIEKLYEQQIEAGNLKILGNKPIEEMELDPAKNYLQIVSCEVYLEYDELVSRDYHTYSDRDLNVQEFCFQLPYSPDGTDNREESISNSWKRKIILKTSKCFPYMLQRLPVVKKDIRILEPAESALDLMMTIVSRFKQALNRVPPNSKTVQIILQGSVLTQVNAGPLAIIKEFLGNASKYPSSVIEKLGVHVKTFVRLCQFGIRLNATLIETKPELAPLHNEIVKAFAVLRDEAAKYLDVQ